MQPTKTRRAWFVLAAAVLGCAANDDVVVASEGQAAIPDTPITEREQYEGSLDPMASEDHTTEPSPDIDGPIEGLAPRYDVGASIDNGDGTAVTVDALAACRPATGYQAGRPVSICVTEVDGKLVEYRTAQAYVEMKAAAARAGVTLRIVSGWRTMEKQRELYNLYISGRGNLAARPGYSNHQNGLALDLNTSDRGVSPWLNTYGSRYGFRRTVPGEPWHWERPAGSQATTTGSNNSDRCWSSTLGREMPPRACVQSRSDSAWYQCTGGLWRAGRGSYGACDGSYALGSATSPTTAPPATCFSSTRQRDEAVGVCVQSRFDRVWYQCTRGGWAHSSSLPTNGAAGTCTARYAL